MSTDSRMGRIHRRAVCTGESVNTIHRLKVSPTEPLIPAAASARQRYLEARLLSCWIAATDEESSRKLGGHGAIVPSFASAVHPFPDHLGISVTDPALLLPLLRSMRPRRVHGKQLGIPGLRTYWCRNYLELQLVDEGNEVQGRVRFWGIDRQRGNLLVRAERLRSAFRQMPSGWVFSKEKAQPSAQQDSFMSALLRRFPLWRAVDRISINVIGNIVSVRWQGGPERGDVEAILSESSCRITPNRLYFGPADGDAREIFFIDGEHRDRDVVEPWHAWNAVHAQMAGRNGFAVAPLSWTTLRHELEDPEMRSALARGEVGTIYKLLRRRGVSQRQIAAMTGQSQSEVSEILKGRQVMAYDVLVRIADGLGVPRKYMGLAYDENAAAQIIEWSEFPESVKRRKLIAPAVATFEGVER